MRRSSRVLCGLTVLSVALVPGAAVPSAAAITGGITSRVSLSSTGRQANGGSGTPALSADGRFVAFVSSGSNLVPGDTNGQGDVFVRDRLTGLTRRLSVSSGGKQAN